MTFEFLHNSKFPSNSWQDPASFDIQCWQEWAGIDKLCKNSNELKQFQDPCSCSGVLHEIKQSIRPGSATGPGSGAGHSQCEYTIRVKQEGR